MLTPPGGKTAYYRKKMPLHAKQRQRGRHVRPVLSILGLLLIVARNGSSPLAAQTSTLVPMNVQAWAILYSPGMPPHPTPQVGGGWYFDFPTEPNLVHYVLAAVNMRAARDVEANIAVATNGTPVFVYNLQPDNIYIYPAHVRLLLQQKGDDLSGRNGKQYFRWWSNSVALSTIAASCKRFMIARVHADSWSSGECPQR